MSFNVGDRVKYVTHSHNSNSLILMDKTGEFIGIVPDPNNVYHPDHLVKWDNITNGHDGGIFGRIGEPGSTAYLSVTKDHLELITTPEPAKFIQEQPHIFDTRDVFKPEVINRIWENTMGRPVEYPKLPPLVEEPEPTSDSEVEYEILDIPLEIGREAICVDPIGGLKVGDRAVITKFISTDSVQFRFVYTAGRLGLDHLRECLKTRWRHFNVKSKAPVDNYFFAIPKKYTREQIENMWKNTQDLSQG